MSNLTNLSTAIKTVLQGVQQSGNPAFADIREYPTTEFDGTPAATIVPSDNTSIYSTIVQNLRTYAFDVDLYYTIQTDNDGLDNSFTVMRTLVDTVMDAFDNSNSLNNNCQLLRPVPSSWAMVQSSKGTLLNARITLQAAITVDTNNG